MKIRILFLGLISFILLFSCSDDEISLPIDTGDFTVTASTPMVSEDGGVITFNFQLPTATQTDVYTYDLTGTATFSEDYVLPSEDLIFSVVEGANTASISFNAINDEDIEDDEETVIITLRERNGIVIGSPATATVIILDDEDLPFERGFLISNEGTSTSFGSVSFISDDFNSIQNDIYQTVNPGSDLGSMVNSIGFSGEFAYIIASGSDRITVVNRFTFEEVAIIDEGLNNPRNFVAIGDKGYVTNTGMPISGGGYIAVIDLNDNIVIDENITVNDQPELIIADGNTLYVSHRIDPTISAISRISVIDITNPDSIEDPLSIPIEGNPNSMEFDNPDNPESLWVLSDGIPSDIIMNSVLPNISKIDLQTNPLVVTGFNFQMADNPTAISIEGGFVYYYTGSTVFRGDLNSFSIPATSIIPDTTLVNINVFGNLIMGVQTGVGEAPGTLKVFDATTFEQINTDFAVGVGPNNIYMN